MAATKSADFLIMVQFSQPVQSIQEVLEWIQKIPMGIGVVQQFLAQAKLGKLSFRAYPTELRAQLQAAQAPDSPVGAAFVTDGTQGQILYDAQGALGLLVPFIFHELIHSLDESLWRGAQQKLSVEDQAQVVLSSEVRAFSAQHLFQEAFKKQYPELRLFHEKQYAHLNFLNRALTRQEIQALYGIGSRMKG